MNFIPTKLQGCFIIEPNVISDERGYFMESYNENTLRDMTGLDLRFVQDNQSLSGKGVLRGLHYQTGMHSQAKLVRVLAGEVLDVAVDVRPDSPTFGEYTTVILSSETHKQIFIPRGFAHGFLVLSESASLFYKCDNFYYKESEGGIVYNDEILNIDWQFTEEQLIISEKDRTQPSFLNAKKVW